MFKAKKRAAPVAVVTARDVPLEERLLQKKNGFAIYPTSYDTQADDDDKDNEDDNNNEPEKRSKPTAAKGKPSKYGPAANDAEEEKNRKRSSKNHPLEISSRRQVTRFKSVVEVKKKRLVDPRFDSMSGRLNEDLFAKSYAFLDDYKVRLVYA